MSAISTPALLRSDKPHQGNGDNYSPGLEGVIAGETAISSVAGGLQYRGYAMEDLADNATYEEVAYLLLHGELPTPGQLLHFNTRLGMFRGVPDPVLQLVRLIPPRTPAMDALRRSVVRGTPFGDERWQERTAKRLALESTLRVRGHPRKIAAKKPK